MTEANQETMNKLVDEGQSLVMQLFEEGGSDMPISRQVLVTQLQRIFLIMRDDHPTWNEE